MRLLVHQVRHPEPDSEPDNDGDEGKNWIKDAVKKPGALHKAAHVKKGEKIPSKTLDKLAHSKNKKTRQRANFAKNMHKISARRKGR